MTTKHAQLLMAGLIASILSTAPALAASVLLQGERETFDGVDIQWSLDTLNPRDPQARLISNNPPDKSRAGRVAVVANFKDPGAQNIAEFTFEVHYQPHCKIMPAVAIEVTGSGGTKRSCLNMSSFVKTKGAQDRDCYTFKGGTLNNVTRIAFGSQEAKGSPFDANICRIRFINEQGGDISRDYTLDIKKVGHDQDPLLNELLVRPR